MMNNNLTHLIKNLQLFYYKREMFRFYLIALSFLFVQSLFTMASAEDNIFNNDTIVIKTFIVQNNNDSSIYYVSASDTAQISINTQPLLSSLWIINLSNDTISFKNLLTNRYLATNTAEDSLIQSQVEYKWVLFDDNQKMRSAYNSSYIFSISSSQGYVIDSVSETMNLISYVQDYDTFTLQVDSNYLVLDTIASSSKLTIYSKQKYKYSPSNNSNTNIIIDSVDVAYTCTVSDTSWLTIINDTLHATALPLNTLARNGTVLISVPSKGESDIIAISQWQDLGNVALRHVNGLSGRPLNSRGLQQTSEYVKTIYTMQDSSVTLNLPFHNGGNSMQSYYCWYNYATLETLNSNLELNNNYRAFNNNSGKYCLGYTGNVFTYKAQNVTFPIEIACDGSAYTDYSLSGSNFYEPTISCRFIFIIDDASILAQKIADANASGTSPTGYLENYNMMIPTNQIVRLVTEYNLTGNSATYFAYNKSGQVEIVSNIKLYIDSTESSLVITKNKYVQLYYPKTLGNSTYQIRGTLSDGTIVNIAQYNLDFVTTSTVGPVEVGSSDMLDNNYQLMMNYNPISNLWFYDLSHDAPFDPFSLTNLGFCYNTTDRSSYPKTSSTNAFATCF